MIQSIGLIVLNKVRCKELLNNWESFLIRWLLLRILKDISAFWRTFCGFIERELIVVWCIELMNWLKWARYRIVKMFFYKLVFNRQKCPNCGIITRLHKDAFKRFMFPSFKLCEIDENLRSLKRQNSDTFDCVKCVEKQNRKCLLKCVNSTFVTARGIW